MLNTPFSPWPSFTEEEATTASRILLSNKVNYWTGNECRAFEKEFAAWCGAKHAIALANGTLALDLALQVLEIGEGDEVIVTSRTFLASASSIVNAGANPVFADVDRNSQNITAETIQAVLAPRTKAIICVHLAGWPCDMDPIMALAKKHSLYVIEDCAQAHGARYKGRSVGSIGDIGAWSFCQDKIMTTAGEGGIFTTNNHTWWERAWAYKDHGKSWPAVYEKQHPPGFRWVHESFGTNWRMTEIQGAIGRIQLRRMQDWTQQRNQNAAKITNKLGPFAKANGLVRLPTYRYDTLDQGGDESQHAFYKYYFFINPERFKPDWNRDRIISEVTARGVPCYQGSCSEVYLEKAFDDTGWRPLTRLPVARELGDTSLMLLVHPTLLDDEVAKTCSVLMEVLSEASTSIPV